MAAPVLTRSLNALRASFNLRFLNRDHASDGWIGDRAHQQSTSGHNPDDTPGVKAEYSDSDSKPEVRAIDVDADLRDPKINMLKVIQAILADPNALKRLRYIIFNRVIWSRTTGWQPRVYTGSNPHDKHAHFSGNPADDENAAGWPAVTNIGKAADVALTITDVRAIITYNLTPGGDRPVTVGECLLDAHRLWAAWPQHDKEGEAAAGRADGILSLTDVPATWSTQNPGQVQPNVLRQALEQIHAAIGQVSTAPADPAALQAAVQQVMLSPAFLTALAAAYATENARRLAE